MKNFKQFSSKALDNKALAKIKGGEDACSDAWAACAYLCDLGIDGGYLQCVHDANVIPCSPLLGWEQTCGYN